VLGPSEKGVELSEKGSYINQVSFVPPPPFANVFKGNATRVTRSAPWVAILMLGISTLPGCARFAFAAPIDKSHKSRLGKTGSSSSSLEEIPTSISMRPIRTAYHTGRSNNLKLDRPLTLLSTEVAQYRLLRERKLAESIFSVEEARNEYQGAISDYEFAKKAVKDAERGLCRFRSDYASWRRNPDLFSSMPEVTDYSYDQAFDLRGFVVEMQHAERHMNACKYSLYLNQRREQYWQSQTYSRIDFKRTLPDESYHLNSALSESLVGNWQVQSDQVGPNADLGTNVLEASTLSLRPDGVEDLQHYFVLHIDPEGIATAEQFFTISGHTYVLAAVIGQIKINGDDGSADFSPPNGGFNVEVLEAYSHSINLAPVLAEPDSAYIKTLPAVKNARVELAKLLAEAFPVSPDKATWKVSMTDQETFDISTGDGKPTYRLSRLYFGAGPKCTCPTILLAPTVHKHKKIYASGGKCSCVVRKKARRLAKSHKA
jgi:hypothetical protein